MSKYFFERSLSAFQILFLNQNAGCERGGKSSDNLRLNEFTEITESAQGRLRYESNRNQSLFKFQLNCELKIDNDFNILNQCPLFLRHEIDKQIVNQLIIISKTHFIDNMHQHYRRPIH